MISLTSITPFLFRFEDGKDINSPRECTERLCQYLPDYDDELHSVLEQHLKSDDFFFVKLFPKAVFTITEGKPKDPAWLTSPNYSVKGELKLRGVSAALEFDATVNKADENSLDIESHFDIDRTQWNVIYGSARFFEHLGMHKVFDLISIQVNVIAEQQS